MSLESQFVKQIHSLLTNVTSIVADCHDNKITTMSPDEVNFVRGMVSEDKAQVLLDAFINDGHAHWEKAWFKNSEFATNEMPKIFEKHFDARVLAVPFKCLADLKKGISGFSDPDSWPVIEDDIRAMWVLVGNLIRIAIRYAVANESRYPGVGAANYAMKFGIAV